MFNESHFQKKKLKKNIYLSRLFIGKYIEDPNSHFSLYKTAENIFGKT